MSILTNAAIEAAENCRLVKVVCPVVKELYGYSKLVVSEKETLLTLDLSLREDADALEIMREIISERADEEHANNSRGF